MEFDTEDEAKQCIVELLAALKSDEEYLERF
jgi:hypothetical protein